MSYFQSVDWVAGDPIMGLLEVFRADPNPAKLDLGVGVYKNAQGQTPILQAVKQAEQRLLGEELTKSYIGGHGDVSFGSRLLHLVLGEQSAAIINQRAGCTQAVGGTGALRLAGDFIAHSLPGRSIWLSDPTWPIHKTLFKAAGLKVNHYPYVGIDNRLHIEEMLDALKRIPKGDVVLLHACCHNPTGFDLSHDNWQKVLGVVKARELLPLFDFAYQGFGDGLDEDAWAIRLFADALPELLVTSSCSKNFGLYRKRTGALIVVAEKAEHLLAVRSQLTSLARNLWSTPPSHGAAVVNEVLGNFELHALWKQEVENMRVRIKSLRAGLVEALIPYGLDQRFAHIAEQRGMFSYTGLTPEQVAVLRKRYSVYLVSSGRANIAGLDEQRLDELARQLADVCQ